jgi:Fe2+ transport system protein FeoA
MNITELLEGENAIIDSCNHRRLMEQGFTDNTPVHIYMKLPSMTCVYIRGTIIACRNKDLEDISVKYYKE